MLPRSKLPIIQEFHVREQLVHIHVLSLGFECLKNQLIQPAPLTEVFLRQTPSETIGVTQVFIFTGEDGGKIADAFQEPLVREHRFDDEFV